MQFTKFAEVHYAFITPAGIDETVLKHFQDKGIKTYPFIADTNDNIFDVVKNIFSFLPFKFKKYVHENFLKSLVEVVRTENIDAVWINHAHMAEYALQIKQKCNVPIYLREHNIEYSLVEQLAYFISNPLKKLIIQWQAKKTKAFEIKCWEKFDHVFFISDSDMDVAKENIKSNNSSLLYDSFIESENNSELAIEKEPLSFIFTGSFGTLQNKLNIQKFVREIWIAFAESHPSYKLYLTGNKEAIVCETLGRDYEKHNIINLGFVDDIEACIKAKAFFLSPTYIGSGVRIKVLNAMSLGSVCFLSGKDMEMLSVLKDKENALLFEDLDSFIEKVNFIQDDAKKIAISENAKHIVNLPEFSWQYYGSKVKSVIA